MAHEDDSLLIGAEVCLNQQAHLTIYKIIATPDADRTRKVVEQFHTDGLRITCGVWLGVPAKKHGFRPIR